MSVLRAWALVLVYSVINIHYITYTLHDFFSSSYSIPTMLNAFALSHFLFGLLCFFVPSTSDNKNIVLFCFSQSQSKYSIKNIYIYTYMCCGCFASQLTQSNSWRRSCHIDATSTVLSRTRCDHETCWWFSMCRWCWIPSWLPSWCPTSQLHLQNAEDMMLRCENPTM